MKCMNILRAFLLASLFLVVFGADNTKADDEWDYDSPQAQLCCNEWTGDWDYDNSQDSYTWYENDDSNLISDTFTIWNSQPVLVVEAEYDLNEDSNVKAQVKIENHGAWYDIKWRSIDRVSTLYSIPGEQYDDHPGNWNGSSDRETFFADLGSVEQIGDADGNLQEQFIGLNMQIRFVASAGSGSGGSFKVFSPSVVGVDEHAVAVKEVSPGTQNAIPSSLTGGMVTKIYTVKSNNFGAVSDSGVIDFVIKAPDNSFIELDDGTFAVIDSILQKKNITYVAIDPITSSWGSGRDDPNNVEHTAYIGEDGLIEWPSGTTEQFSATGWIISNPTKSTWDDEANKPTGAGQTTVSPGEISTIDIIVQVGFAKWALPGTYVIQADVRSWLDYDNTFTSDAPNGQAFMTIAKPDLTIGGFEYTDHATGNSNGQGWAKNSCMKFEGQYFIFMVEVLNIGTETVSTFYVGPIDSQGNPLGIYVGLYSAGNAWAVDESKTTAEGAEIIADGSKEYVKFKATAEELGMSAGPGDDTYKYYNFYMDVDVNSDITESNENNNRLPMTLWAVKPTVTTGGVNGFIGYDISLMSGEMPKSRSSIEGNVTPTGSMIASEDGSGVWTIQMVKMSPHVAVSSLYWYLLDESDLTVSHGLVSDIYGCLISPGTAVRFIDNDLNGMLSPGDKFEFYPGVSSTVLESVDSLTNYQFRLRYIGNDTSDIALGPLLEPVIEEVNKEENLSDEDKDGVLDDFDACPGTIQGQSVDDFGCVLSSDENKQEENKEQEKDTENYDSGPVVESLEEESEISSLGLVTVLLPIVLIAIFRRK